MADRLGTVNKFKTLSAQVGRAALSAFYPNDIEYYLCAFELVDSLGTENYLVFPIQPSSIQKLEPTRTNIKKSLAGITVLQNSSFIPQELSIKGNFGKHFKILNGLNGVAFRKRKSRGNKAQFDSPIFSTSIKTGYGAIKVLQKILNDSTKIDSLNRPKRLYFYNLGLGESYMVKVPPSGLSLSQTEDTNMIWQYSVSMSVLSNLADISEISDVKSANNAILARGVIQKTINTVANEVKLIITS